MSKESGRMMEIEEMLQQRHGTWMTRIGQIYTDTHYPCASASSVQSVFYPMDNKPQRAQRTQREVSNLNVFSAPAPERAPPAPAVDPRMSRAGG